MSGSQILEPSFTQQFLIIEFFFLNRAGMNDVIAYSSNSKDKQLYGVPILCIALYFTHYLYLVTGDNAEPPRWCPWISTAKSDLNSFFVDS